MTVTGNNTTFLEDLSQPQTGVTGTVMDLSTTGAQTTFGIAPLPDHDVYRIDPTMAGAAAVTPVVHAAGSLLFDLEKAPGHR